MRSPYRDAHQITVYHPNDANSYISIGWSGFIGVIAGINQNQISSSAMPVYYPDSTFSFPNQANGEPEMENGLPYYFLIKNILYFNSNLNEARAELLNSTKNRNIIMAIADAKVQDYPFITTQYR